VGIRKTGYLSTLPAKEVTLQSVLRQLKSHGSRRNVEGMAHFGVTAKKAFGVAAPALHRLARKYRKNHELALKLWSTGIHDARILAALIDDPKKITRGQMERWVKQFDNWAVCDTACGKLFDKTPWAYQAALKWSKQKKEFVKRAGYAMMAWIAVHDKGASDKRIMRFLPHIRRGAVDERNFVKKAVNWALRQIGKRNLRLNKAAILEAKRIHALGASSARWIASDALRELTGKNVQKRLK